MMLMMMMDVFTVACLAVVMIYSPGPADLQCTVAMYSSRRRTVETSILQSKKPEI